ncbi:efflux RND transporter periplasmic adaptor subunit [Maricaulis sp.]|uniref:efflux RND transporter periplasmic adaptor subunit n=1 Tax=unclassified Maricaulis TaxID=2632371 RepID=UPI001B283245|nr:efflux RND transporter periplasmic adaptor subunit [Maricaulis sp.]MBO6797236.1 efflux RND transporter periplasmic adaptor subunit [Maricaulis sp.]
MSDRSSQLHSLSIDRSDDEGPSGAGFGTVATVAVLAAALGAAGTWWLMRSDATEQPQEAAAQQATTTPPPVPQETTPAPTRPERSSGLVASGYVVARRQATVSADLTGRIREVLVEEGTVVEEGQILARLDDERAQIQLSVLRTQSTASQARSRSLVADVEEAQRVLDRATTLLEREIGSEASVTAAQARLSSLQAQLAASRADAASIREQIRSQEDLIDRHIVRAPFAGVVIAKNAQVGEILSPASAGGGFTRTGVATLVDMQSLEIEVDVNESQIGRVVRNQRVEARLDAYADWRIAAHVEAIIPTADRSRATIRVRVAFDERDDRILPDMAARVTFVE